jgi:ATP-dependent HslUV protease ATP-binding subunit HslU
LTPQEIVRRARQTHRRANQAKRAVAIALRNRWRRQQVQGSLRAEITPKNILMIGPTGVGKTEIARRLARLADAPFIKVEASKFTEVGYVGKDVDTIIRDLADVAVKQTRESAKKLKVRERALDAAEERILDILMPPPRGERRQGAIPRQPESAARQAFRKKLREGQLGQPRDRDRPGQSSQQLEIMGPAGMEEMTEQLRGMFGQLGQQKRQTRKLRIAEALKLVQDEEAAKLVNEDDIKTQALLMRPSRTASSSSTRSTRSPRAPKAMPARCRARACSVICCRWSRARPCRPNTA